MHRRSHGPVETLESAPDVASARSDKGAKSAVPHYYGVSKLGRGNRTKPYQAQYYAGGKRRYLGTFKTAEEAALKVASLPTALLSDRNTTGYYGVSRRMDAHRTNKPFQAQVNTAGGYMRYLGSFATPEEAALCVASSAEGRDYVERAAAKSLLALEAKKKKPNPVVEESEPQPTVSRRSCWTEEEETRLQAAITEIGVDKFLLGSREAKWDAVAKIVGTRSMRQCARRWHANGCSKMLRTSGRLKRRLEFSPRSPEPSPPPKPQNQEGPPPLPDEPVRTEEQVEMEQLADLFDDAVVESEAPAPWDVPQFKLSPGEEQIYDHYGLLAIESLDDVAYTPVTHVPKKTPALRHVVGAPLKSSFQFAPQRLAKTKRNTRLRKEQEIREHQAAITGYMLNVYRWQ